MDLLTFIADVIKAAAWPITAGFIAFLFRAQFRELLGRMKKGKVGLAEFEFEESVRALKEEAPELPRPSTGLSKPTVELMASNGRAAILEAWLGVEEAAQRLARSRNVSIAPPRGPLALVRTLEQSQAFNARQIAIFNDLRSLRNQAAHDSDFNPSIDSVLSYVDVASGLREAIEMAIHG